MSVRVASVPAGHVYVRHLSPPEDEGDVTRLPDPRPGTDIPDAQWWPPVMLQPDWIEAHHDEFDLMHVHFGFDAADPQRLHAVVEALRRHGKPLVLTVHDLRNPHHTSPEVHDAQLDVLIPGADALVTLTEGAAREVQCRWGRRPVVIPHPHVVPLERLTQPRPEHDGYRIGVHAKSLRAGMAPLPVIEQLAALLPELPGAVLQVDAHTDVMTPGHDHYDARFAEPVRTLADAGVIDLRVHDYFSDDDLWDYLQSLDLSVLPYRFGTHSGWLESCYDLGTAVAAPDCGYYADQRPCLTYATLGTDSPATSLPDVVRRAHRDRPHWRADPAQREAERRAVAAAHEDLYRRLLEGRPCTS